jgi:excisionase family DNA binding protein
MSGWSISQMERLLSVSEVAQALGGISKWTVHAWLSQGKLQRTKVGGRTMIRESELAKVIQDGGKSASPRRKDNVRCRRRSGELSAL